MNTVWDNLNMWIYGVASALAAGIILLIRKILTNEKQVGLLKMELEHLKENGNRVEKHITDLQSDVKVLLSRHE